MSEGGGRRCIYTDEGGSECVGAGGIIAGFERKKRGTKHLRNERREDALDWFDGFGGSKGYCRFLLGVRAGSDIFWDSTRKHDFS